MLLQNLILLLSASNFVAASPIPGSSGQIKAAINFPETQRELKEYLKNNVATPQIKSISGYSSLPLEFKELRDNLSDPSKQQEQFKNLAKYREKIKMAYKTGKP